MLALASVWLALLVCLGVNLARPAQTAAATSNTINFQARLENASGSIVGDGWYNVEFKLYNASTSGTLEWTEDRTWSNGSSSCTGAPNGTGDCRLQVINGYLTANLGSITAFSGINWDQQQWLTMNIGGTVGSGTITWDGEMSPRLQLTAVPYAFRAGQLALQTGANESTLGFATQTTANSLLLPNEGGTLCVDGDTTNCGFAPTTLGTGYIQNQNASPQTGSNFSIDGSGTAGTSFIAPSYTSAAALGVAAGGTNANLTLTANGTGTATLDTTGAGTVSIATNATTLNLANDSGTNIITVGGSGANTIAIGNTQTAGSIGLGGAMTTGTISIGGTAQTGTLTLGSSSGTNILNIANGSGATTLNLANVQTAGSVNIGSAMTTGTISIGGTGAQTGTISLGTGTGVQAINLATGGTGAKTVTVGSSASTSSLSLQGGTGAISLTPAATGTILIGAAAQTGNITLGSSSGTNSVLIGNGTGATTVSIANANTAGAVNVGTAFTTGTISIGGTAQTGTLTLGSSSGTNTLNIANGSGATTLGIANVQNAGSVSIGAGMTTGTISIGGTGAQTGTISLGTGTGVQAINLATGGTGAKTVTVGSSASTSSLTLQSGTGAISLTPAATGTILIGAAAQTGNITLGSSSGTNTLNIANGSGATTLTLANVQNAGSVSIGAGMTTGTISIGGTGAQTGTISLGTGTGVQAINLATGGTGAKTVTVGSTASTSSLLLQSGTGGTTFTPAGGSSNLGVLIQPTSNTSAAFQVENSSNTVLLGVNTTANTVSFNGGTNATAGAEKFTASQSFTAGSGWTTNGLTGSSATITHSSGVTAISPSTAITPTANLYYQVSFVISCGTGCSGSPTAGQTVTPSIGGASGTPIAGNDAAEVQIIQAANTGNLAFTPTTSWNGTISSISVKQITSATSAANVAGNTFNGSGDLSAFYGFDAGLSNITTSFDTGIGPFALQSATTGTNNTALGSFALGLATTGSNNVGIGYGAGYTNTNAITTGSNNTFIGYNSGPGNAIQLQNSSAIGTYSVVNQSNSLVLGCLTGVNGCTTSTNVGIDNATPGFALDVTGTVNAGTQLDVGGSSSTSLTASTLTIGGTAVCTVSGCTPTGGGGSGLAKNAVDTSTAAVTAVQADLYTFTNSSSGIASGVLSLNNGTNTNSTLNVTASGNPTSGQALIFASNTNASPSGNLLDLQAGSSPTSQFSVSATGNVSLGGTSPVTIQGTATNGTLNVDANGTGTLNLDTTGAGTVSIGSNAAILNLSTDSGTNTITLGGSGPNTIAIGNTQTGGSISLGTALTTGNITLGSTAMTTGTTLIQGGTAAAAILLTTGSSSGAAGGIQIGNTTGANTQTINIGNNTTASSSTTVNIGSNIGASPVAVSSGTSGTTFTPAGGSSNNGVLIKPGSDTTAAFQIQKAGTTADLLNANTSNMKLTVQAGTDTATNSELFTSSESFPTTSGWTSISGTGSSATATHSNGGGITALSPTPGPPTFNIASPNTYQVTYTVTGANAGSTLSVTMGGQPVRSYSFDLNAGSVSSFTDGNQITATNANNLAFTPSTNFTGKISNVSVQLISANTNPVLVVNNASGTDNIELRASSSTSNMFIGSLAGEYNNSSGTNNLAIGGSALQNNTSGSYNAALGLNALQNNTTGTDNTATGYEALQDSTTGYANSAFGYSALVANTDGIENTAVGSLALATNSSGYQNTAIGQFALQFNTTGYGNSGFGQATMEYNTTGNMNTGVGASTLQNNTSGSGNSAIGLYSLSNNITGNDNSAFGMNTNVLVDGISSSTVLGYGAQVGANNNLILGYGYADSVNSNVGIGTSFAPSEFTVSPQTYSSGTISQGGTTTVTGSGFTSGMTGGTIFAVNNVGANISETVTYVNATTLTASASNTITSGANWVLVWGGFNVNNNATVLLQPTTNSTTAFQIQNAAGSSLLTADTFHAEVGIGGTPATSLLTVGTNTSTAAGGLTFGTDTDLYRFNTNTLKTDSSLIVAGSTTLVGNTLVGGSGSTNSSTAFQVQDASGASVLLVDTTSTAANGSQVNYLTYPGFESGSFSNASAGWNSVASTLTQNTAKSNTYNGLYSAKVVGTGINDGLTTSSFITPPLTGTYEVSFYVEAGSGTLSASSFTIQSTDGTTHTCTPAVGTITATGFQRVYCSTPITTTGTMTALQITYATSVTFYVDAVQLQSTTFDGGTITAPTPYQIGGIMLRGVIQNPLAILPNADSNSVLQVSNAAGTNILLNVDTLNSIVAIGTQGSTAINSTVNIANSTAGTQVVSVGSTTSGSTVTIQGGSTSGAIALSAASGGTISIGATNSNTITVGATTSTATLTLGRSTSGETVAIANGAVTGTNTVNIGTAATGAGIETIGIGSALNTSTLTLQGGTSASSIKIQSGSTGTITIGNQTVNNPIIIGAGGSATPNDNIGIGNTSGTNASTITIGGSGTATGAIILGQSTGSQTISIGKGAPAAGATQAISIGTTASATTGTTTVAIGGTSTTTNGATSVTILAGNHSGSTVANASRTTTDTDSTGIKVSLGDMTGTTALCAGGLASATAPTSGLAYELIDCSSTPIADYAEEYPVATGVQVGDVVATGSQMVNTYDSTDGSVDWTKVKGQITQLVQSDQAYQPNAIGIVSDNNSDFSSTGYNIKAEDNPMSVALNGRVPVNVTTENGPIEPGDFLTTSATHPGYAMKATQAGYVIGQALAAYTSSDPGQVMTFVKNTYYPGPDMASMIQNGSDATLSNLTVNGNTSLANLDVAGDSTLSSLNVSGPTTLTNLTVTGDTNLGGNLTVVGNTTIGGSLTVTGLTTVTDINIGGHIITSGGQPTTQAESATGVGAAVQVAGTDTTGTITITTGSNPTSGSLADIIFSKVYGNAPHVVLSPSNNNAAGLRYFKGNTTANDFVLNVIDNPAPNTTYQYDYFIGQ